MLAGQKASFDILITQELHDQFRALSGDFSAIHTSVKFSHSTKFQKPIGYAGFLHALLSRLYGEYLPAGRSICLKTDVNYRQPYFAGDTLTVCGEVTSFSEAASAASIKVKILRGNTVILDGTSMVQVLFDSLPALYSGDNAVYSRHVTETFRMLSISEEDSVFIHSDIVPFGRLGSPDRKWFMDTTIQSFIHAVGVSGTVLMPVFTYSFCKNEVYDVQKSPSTVGVITEEFRKTPGVIRNMQPIFSTAGYGKDATTLLSADNNCFGEKSMFANLHKHNAWLVFWGADINSATFAHYVEQSYGVPYRYMKKFTGRIVNMGAEYETTADYYVRDLDKNPILNLSALCITMEKEGALKKATLANGTVLAVRAKDFFDIGTSMLTKNIYSLLKEKY